ncbi:MAG: phospho-sugar mutase [Myxococcaceae bacterium]|nr:phospho-sugar mutase [Myxococcaceae bacterium]
MSEIALQTLARAWAEGDVDAQAAAQVRALLDAQKWAELKEGFEGALEFGTAGLRGVLGPGPNRMNRAVVIRTTAGLARYLKTHVPDCARRGVVVGRDGRRQSDVFAEDVAMVLAAEGIAAHVFEDVVPTPVTAFALLKLNAAAAVMVTASHNPPEYNGYKVYWGNGAQIVPPHDTGIAQSILHVEPAAQVKRATRAEAVAAGLYVPVPAALERAYFDAILALRPTRQTADLRVVYSAMHGVGGRFVAQAMREAGFTHVFPVPEQQQPDGLFPTVRFPNPEEPGALDLSTALATAQKADVVLANDPDADRLAVMARDEGATLKLLTGNEVGILLAHFLLTRKRWKKPLVITTIVSTAQLKSLAAALSAAYEETLTGFKWIANQALEREKDGFTFVCGFEEALGYTVGTVARDKDGVGAALVVADMAAWCKANGKTLFGYLEEIQRAHGLFVARQASFTLPGASGAATIRAVMEAFRAAPPASIGRLGIAATNDYEKRTRVEGKREKPLALPQSNVIAYELEGGSRVTLRPSGTEPKVKFYVEWKETMAAGEPMAVATARAHENLLKLEADVLALAYERGLPAKA